MKKILALVLVLTSSLVGARELITLEIGNSPSQPNVPAYLRTIEEANRLQQKYEFIAEFKPGANGALAVKAIDSSPLNRLATTAPAFVENSKQGLLNESDYVPVLAQGDACWAVITNIGDTARGVDSLKGQKELVVGGTGYGNASHLTAIMIGEKFGIPVRYIVYKANYDALVAMASNVGINFTLERVSNYVIFKEKNPNLQVLGINCPKRNPLMPNIKTMREQGFNTPGVFFTVVAHKKMPESKRDEISKILVEAQAKAGSKYLMEAADLVAPQFNTPPVTAEDFFNKRVIQMHYLTTKYKDQIDSAR
jgi:tripartite-type tricarboxylate transporter receptor subunit TctC